MDRSFNKNQFFKVIKAQIKGLEKLFAKLCLLNRNHIIVCDFEKVAHFTYMLRLKTLYC